MLGYYYLTPVLSMVLTVQLLIYSLTSTPNGCKLTLIQAKARARQRDRLHDLKKRKEKNHGHKNKKIATKGTS